MTRLPNARAVVAGFLLSVYSNRALVLLVAPTKVLGPPMIDTNSSSVLVPQ
jgi:hypothetical protein